MQCTLTYHAFLQVPYDSGTVQNLCERAPVEVSDSAVADTGMLLAPGESFSFRNATVFIRAGWPGGEVCRAAVIPLAGGGSGGGGDDEYPVATDQDIQDIIEDYYPDDQKG